MGHGAGSMGHGAEGMGHGAGSMGYRAESLGLILEREGLMVKFRFQDLKIWQSAIEIANDLFDIADDLEKRKLYRWAEQLRASGLSMSNNIAEGSGSSHKKEFSNFLNIARRSTFENANALILFEMRNLINLEQRDDLLTRLDILCRQITNFIKSLK